MTMADAVASFNRSISTDSQNSLTTEGGDNSEVSSSSPMPPPPPPPPRIVNDLAGRKTITLKRGNKKKDSASKAKFYITENLSVESDKLLRVPNDPGGGSIDIICISKKVRPRKYYEFDLLENYGTDLFEATIYFLHHMNEPPLILPKLDQLSKKGNSYDVSRMGEPEFPKNVYEVGNLKVFMNYQLGSWHMIIRKYKAEVMPNRKPYFHFGLPEYYMLKFACVMKYFIHIRGLKTPTMSSLRDAKLSSKLQYLVDYKFEEPKDDDLPVLVTSDSEANEIAALFDSVENEQESQDILESDAVNEILPDSSSSVSSSVKNEGVE